MMSYNQLFDVIKLALWNTGTAKADLAIYEEMKTHAIEALAGSVLPSLSLSPELLNIWKKDNVRHFAKYYHFVHAQMALPLSVPFAILKGTSAAQYYPFPEYRVLGDIDIMTKREDYAIGCENLLANVFNEIINEENIRHREFVKQNIVVEVHAYFASLNDPVRAKYLDDLIIENVNPSHVLPDMVNGLVLLEHISQHLEHGLGLRQIIDWMMFVDKCLPNEKWLEFQAMAEKIGLETLAISATRMCEVYLGLSERSWAAKADTVLCERLMDYVMACGNFGNKQKEDDKPGAAIISYARNPKALFSLLQESGIKNWKAARNHPSLRPFAWAYQAGRYFVKGFGRKNAVSKLHSEFEMAKQRNALFDALGVKQTSKGLAVYQDGEYKLQ